MSRKHNHYFKDVSHLKVIDIYRVLTLFNVTDPALAHAAKKIVVAGGRGNKDIRKDVQEAIDTLVRWQEMQDEMPVCSVKEVCDIQGFCAKPQECGHPL